MDRKKSPCPGGVVARPSLAVDEEIAARVSRIEIDLAEGEDVLRREPPAAVARQWAVVAASVRSCS
jgi:hypothetical protein